jgi:hypothetical protein
MLLKLAPGAEGLFDAADFGAADFEAADFGAADLEAAGFEPGVGCGRFLFKRQSDGKAESTRS